MRYFNFSNWLLIIVGTILIVPWFSLVSFAQATSGLEVTSIVLSKNCVETKDPALQTQAIDNPECPMAGDTQLIQVSVENQSFTSRKVRISLEIKLDGKRQKLYRETHLIPSSEEYKILYSYNIPEKGGEYHVSARILDANSNQMLAKSSTGVNRVFYILRQSEIELAESRIEEQATETARLIPKKLEFDPPDLRWENLHVVPKHVLRGEKFRIRLDLINVGGDIVRSIKYQIDFYNVRLPRRRTAIAAQKVDVLAPGETATREFEYSFPDDQLLGEYQIMASVDPANLISEIKETNNQKTSDIIRLSDIKLLIPSDGFQFEETGLFLFQWDSLLFREFKLQIGINDKFNDTATYFDLPQGERWIADKELVPLSGELPTLAQGLMKTYKKSIVYWRVIGRKSDGQQSTSDTRTFSIKSSTPET
ncbi:MAG: hypothetical protein HQM14_00630 [SAR324 cluster bacterium]|nr:hypothetical protein [SAR324 cluster bacterium]